MQIRSLAGLLAAILLTGAAQAAVLSYAGFLDDPTNTALVGSGPDPDSPLFGNDFEIANNVALYTFTVAAAGNVSFESVGYAAGGVEPYFSLFLGTGPSATFLASNLSVLPIDFFINLQLAAGDYTIAIGAWQNMSMAENLDTGTLGDGFTALGNANWPLGGRPYYELLVDLDAAPPPPPPGTVSEPASSALLAFALIGCLLFARRRPAMGGRPPQ